MNKQKSVLGRGVFIYIMHTNTVDGNILMVISSRVVFIQHFEKKKEKKVKEKLNCLCELIPLLILAYTTQIYISNGELIF